MKDRSATVAKGLRYWLILHPGQPSQQAVEMSSGRMVMGRGGDCDLVLDDPSVSRHHAAISARPGTLPMIEDLGSANGTFVNGRPIKQGLGFKASEEHAHTELQGGEMLQFGDTIAVISLVPPGLAGIPEPPPTGETEGDD